MIRIAVCLGAFSGLSLIVRSSYYHCVSAVLQYSIILALSSMSLVVRD